MTKQEEAVTLVQMPTNRQRLFLRYTLAILVDLAVLGLFDEYWDKVHIATFTIALLTAVLLQAMLQVTFKIEHRVNRYFKAKSGTGARVAQYLTVWLILIISKLVILGVIERIFGEHVHFSGVLHGAIPFIVVVIVMLVVEQLVALIYRRLGDDSDGEPE